MEKKLPSRKKPKLQSQLDGTTLNLNTGKVLGTPQPIKEFQKDGRFNDYAVEIAKLHRLLEWFSTATTSRATVRQILAFSLIAERDVDGDPITMTEIRNLDVKDRETGYGIFSSALTRSLDIFFHPSISENPSSLTWISTVAHPDDKRAKYLRLTTYGRKAYEEMLSILR